MPHHAHVAEAAQVWHHQQQSILAIPLLPAQPDRPGALSRLSWVGAVFGTSLQSLVSLGPHRAITLQRSQCMYSLGFENSEPAPQQHGAAVKLLWLCKGKREFSLRSLQNQAQPEQIRQRRDLSGDSANKWQDGVQCRQM